MRKLATALLAAGISLGPVAAIVPASAEDDPAATKGQFTTPFREDLAPYDASTNTFGGERGDTGCLPVDENNHHDCLPAGASENVLADGRILYWNAIEGAEDLDDPSEAAVPSGGDAARDDRSRVLSLNWDDPQASSWAEPENPTGYFEGTPSETPLIPGTSNDNNDPARDYASNGSLFCSDQKQLADGTILAAGGTNYYAEPRLDPKTGVIELEGVRNARIFDPADNAWKKTGDLNYGRWYPSMVTLPDGDLFIASGVTKLIKPLYPWRAIDTDSPGDSDPAQAEESGDNVPQTETYDVETGTWTDNGASAERSLPLFPRLHLLPNGHVYYDAAGQAFNPMGQSYKQALWNLAATYDPATKAWTNLGVPGLAAPSGSNVSEPGFRGSTFSQALPFLPDRETGDYNKASFLTAGGVLGMSPGSYFPTDSTRINTVDVSGGTETLTTVAAEKLGRPRWYSSAVTLPTGQVLTVSGADVDEVASPGMESPIRQAEMFTPFVDDDGNYVGGEWNDVAIQNRKRTYHNNAVLLPDGRVLIGGHAPIPHSYYNVRNNPDVPGVREGSNNFKDASFELYEPPYLHWGEQRPVIGNLNPDINTGEKLIVPTSDPVSVASVVLVRNPAETHLIDGDQRVVVLPITDRTGDALHVDVTDNTAVLPPGPYMMFINKQTSKGLVPSVAKQVFVDANVPGWARGADTYPTDETVATSAPSTGGVIAGLPTGAAVAAAGEAVADATSSGLGIEARTVSSERAGEESRTPVLVLGGVALLIAMGSLAGTRRRRLAPVRIKK